MRVTSLFREVDLPSSTPLKKEASLEDSFLKPSSLVSPEFLNKIKQAYLQSFKEVYMQKF